MILSFLMIISLLVFSANLTSQMSAISSSFQKKSINARYIAESQASTILWNLLNDRQKFKNRKMGSPSLSESKRYIADGKEIISKQDEYKITITVLDMAKGTDISNRNDLKKLGSRLISDKDNSEKKNALMDKIKDYLDKDDLVRANGAEKDEYSNNLPRNNKIQYREELLYIPEISKIYKNDLNSYINLFRRVAPYGLSRITGKSNIFSENLDHYENELDNVIGINNAISQWKSNNISMEDTLDNNTIKSLKSRFSFSESGFYEINIKVENQEGLIFSKLSYGINLQRGLNSKEINYYF